MYVVDITRTKDELDSDMLVGKDSMDTKAKIMNYVSNFILSNYSIYVDRDLLDQHLNIELFFLKDFMRNNYNLNIDKNLIIQSVHTDKEHCLFVKFFNKNLDDFPTIYMLEKNDLDNARKIMTYITNDELINKFQDDLSLYDKNKLDYDMNMDSYSFAGVECNIISLYDSGGMFLEELLNNNYSLKDINKNDLGGIDI